MSTQTLDSLCSINPEALGAATPMDMEFRYLDISAVTKGQVDWSATQLWKYANAPSRARRRLRSGDVLLCTVRPGLQAHARIRQEADAPLVGSTGFAVLRPNLSGDSGFVFHQIFGDSVATQLRALETGSSYPAVNESDVRRISVFCPEKEERWRITAVLDTVDEAIAKTEAVIAKLRQVRAGLLHDLLTRGLDQNGQLRDPIAHPEQFQDSPIGRIPSEWIVRNVSALANNRDARRVPLKQGDRDTRHGIYPYYGASGVIDFIDDYLFDGDFVLIGEDGENLRSRQLPLAFIASGKFWVNNHAHIFEPLPTTDVRFLATILEAQDYVPWLLGSAQPKLTQRNLEFVPLRIPPPAEQTKISDALDTIDREIVATMREFSKLRDLKSGLMTDLLTGRVRVPETIGATP
ncbi:MAG: hypothetical protein A3G34_04155 [Candidatus Lindowbacteria bacterium RIFCSPLOWO2_12_FULL_62_27]|nr:MAG: hypothetical protein A3G34_04155 [Candidatus Lindowbacteria bacterium RIFCSPLOWO2_12_FULL_62_27]OGH63641.1 MAG: hypothetical protein A3I06_14300 [Candidatus Lindowbacteria bacterium RIFCSPLOWO2_02_FULL_62_12]